MHRQRLGDDLPRRVMRGSRLPSGSWKMICSSCRERAQLLRRERAQIPSRPHDPSGGYRQERQHARAPESICRCRTRPPRRAPLRCPRVRLTALTAARRVGLPGHGLRVRELDAEIARPQSCASPTARAGPAAAVRARAACGAQQCRGVGLARRLENSRHQAFLDDAPGAHDRHPVGDTGDRAEVVRDQHHRHGALALELARAAPGSAPAR